MGYKAFYGMEALIYFRSEDQLGLPEFGFMLLCDDVGVGDDENFVANDAVLVGRVNLEHRNYGMTRITTK